MDEYSQSIPGLSKQQGSAAQEQEQSSPDIATDKL